MGATTIERLATLEARWFGEGPVDAGLLRWFASAGEIRREPPRTDRYLRLPGVGGVGVKHRADRFEIKARRDGFAGSVVWAGWPAPLDAWLKWSAKLAPSGGDPLPPVEVAKTRWLAVLSGVQVELAELTVADGRHWSFGLEGRTAGELEGVLASPWAAAAPSVNVTFAGAYPGWLDHRATC